MTSLLFEKFELELQNTLYYLYDPSYTVEADVFEVLNVASSQGLDAVRSVIVDAINGLKSHTGYAQPTKSDLLSQILVARFIQGLSQEKAAELLGLSTRHLRRKQNEAVHALAKRLWNITQTAPQIDAASDEADETVIGTAGEAQANSEEAEKTVATWAEMLTKEVDLLNQRSHEVAVSTGDTLRKAVTLAAYLPGSDQVQLVLPPPTEEINLPVHPAVFHQVILNFVSHILHTGYRGPIRLAFRENKVAAVFSFVLQDFQQPASKITPLENLAGALGATLETRRVGSDLSIDLRFARSGRVQVMVVDDNPQVVQVYRRYLANTRYDIAHLSSGQELLKHLESSPVDILMIDILLPDMDGWDLLLQLRQRPDLRNTPVIVCSVIGNEEMARSLGAFRYLPKPVERRSLLAALDEISATLSKEKPETV
jgi:CheY-like chemotaxis protein